MLDLDPRKGFNSGPPEEGEVVARRISTQL
jgi:hypothetical protein